MESLILHQHSLRKKFKFFFQYNHFVHNLQEHYLVDIVPHLIQHNIED